MSGSPAPETAQPSDGGGKAQGTPDADAGARAAQQKKYGKAGRNLPAAIGVGVGIGGVALLGLLVWKPLFFAIVVIAILTGAFEMLRALRIGGFQPPVIPVFVGGTLIMVAAMFWSTDGLAGALFTVILISILWRLAGPSAGYGRDAAASVFVIVYLFLLGGLAILLLEPSDGQDRMIIFVAVTVSNDVGGYIAGVLFGKHPMAPTISPAKSWEGFVGSLILCTAISIWLLTWLLGVSWWTGLIFGPAIAAAATTGDFAESMIKRDVGIKDMGHILPGHGGALDRLDSLAVALPVAWLLLSLFKPVT